tara:strand:- start:2455 stop:3318 length:864 start_codon:yes stop_codon:yes gene_type:complete
MSKLNIIKKHNILVVSHDPGGAQILSSYIKKKKINCHYLLSGPAIEIFRSKLKNIKNHKKDFKKKFDLLITGTSDKNKSEVKYLRMARVKGIYSISFLDSWVNYKRRFKLLNRHYYPNEMIVHDANSLKIAKKVFKKKTKITKINNPYLSSFKIKNTKKNNYLIYLSSNFDVTKKFNTTDKSLFINFLKKIDEYIKNQNIKTIIIKNHPSEKSNKYDFIKKIKTKGFKLRQAKKYQNLEDLLKDSKHVAGFDTMGLVVGKLLKNFVINLKFKGYKSSIPEKYIDKYL